MNVFRAKRRCKHNRTATTPFYMVEFRTPQLDQVPLENRLDHTVKVRVFRKDKSMQCNVDKSTNVDDNGII